MADFDYLVSASNSVTAAALKGDALTDQEALGVANTICNAMLRLASDKTFPLLLTRYANSKLEPQDRENVEDVLRNVAAFAEFSGKEFSLLREGGLSEQAADEAIGQLWSVRSEVSAFTIEPERVMKAIQQAAGDVCRSRDAVKSSKEFRANIHFFLKVVGGSIMVINSVLGPPSLGSLVFISLAGGMLNVIYS